MSLLINIQEISKAFGAAPLFEGVSLTISDGDRLGLIGPNGAGKSTLLQILAGLQEPDTGVRAIRKLLRLGYVAQDSVFPAGSTVGELLTPETFGKAGFTDADVRVESLSGGWRKRLAIARELARAPDVLMLDEPTNHLDLEGILWLEKLLKSAPFASVVVSHDRYFLDNVVNDMAEIDRVYPEGIFRVEGGYSHFLEKKEAFLLAQSSRQESLVNTVRREVEWLRRGAKARTGKSKARIDQAGRLMRELSDLEMRSVKGVAQIDFTATDRRTKRLISVEKISKELGGRTLFRDLSFTLTPGTRLGLLGPNGAGKTTLLRLLSEELAPDTGVIERAPLLRIVYFDQAREQLDRTQTLRQGLGGQSDFFSIPDNSNVRLRASPVASRRAS